MIMDKIEMLLKTGEPANMILAFNLAYFTLELSTEEIAQLWMDWNYDADFVGGSYHEWFMFDTFNYSVQIYESYDIFTSESSYVYQYFPSTTNKPYFELRFKDYNVNIIRQMVSRILHNYFKTIKNE